MSMYVDACGLFILGHAKKEDILIFSIDTVTLNFEKFHNSKKYQQYRNLRHIVVILKTLQKVFDAMFHVKSGKTESIFVIYHE